MRELRALGLNFTAIGRVVGRSQRCAWKHTGDIVVHRVPDPVLVRRAEHFERLFAACNRAVGIEARP